jgi:hypothetical protein
MHSFLKGLAFLVPAIGAMLVLILGVGLAAAIPRLQRLAGSRNSRAAFEEFCAAFPDQPRDLLRSIYSSMQQVVGINNFPVRVDDDLWRTLELDQGSLESEVESFFERRGYKDPTFADTGAPPVTVRDLVRQFYLSERSARV